MKSYPIFFLSVLFVLSSFSPQTNFDKDTKILMSAKIVSSEESVNVLFFTDGSYSLQKLKNGTETNSKSLMLSESELKTLEKLIARAKPLVLKSTYTCIEKKVNKTNATLYYFGKSKKTVIVNNDCQSNTKLNNIRAFVDKILKDDL
ncbi:hypothetical protein [Winogradskyella sp.]|uniref:hypothetical protein n=1 Tax=Winogradskyella sp. TaxID=1883156 RepID=UPI00261EF1FB|nr:hypothetical protein [Winogradskyella sp.]